MIKENVKNIIAPLINEYKVNGSAFQEDNADRMVFIQAYWVREVIYQGEKVKRFEALPKESVVRRRCEDILNTHKIDGRYVRFEECQVYVGLKLHI